MVNSHSQPSPYYGGTRNQYAPKKCTGEHVGSVRELEDSIRSSPSVKTDTISYSFDELTSVEDRAESINVNKRMVAVQLGDMAFSGPISVCFHETGQLHTPLLQEQQVTSCLWTLGLGGDTVWEKTHPERGEVRS